MEDDRFRSAKIFFALNLGLPLLFHLLIALVDFIGPDLRDLQVALAFIAILNVSNLVLGFYSKGWWRTGYFTITAFNILSLFVMGALSFFTSLVGWLHIVPELVAMFY